MEGKRKSHHPVRTITVSGGKGGVGKTVISINLALALSNMGKKVLLFDADLGLANVDVALGLNATHNLSHVLKGEVDLKDIIIEGPLGINIIPAASGDRSLCNLSMIENVGIINAFNELTDEYDILLIDTAAGLSESVINFIRASQEVIVVVCNEPTSIADSYALIKALYQEDECFKSRIVSNMVKDENEGKLLFNKLTAVTNKFLDVQLEYLGSVPYDDYLKKAIKKRKALFEMYPGSKSGKAIQALSDKVVKTSIPFSSNGQIEFFIERLINGKS